ncbi:hypothetical protein BLNAU_17084 [Blattamonas nauphoetae]|uniref:COMM domain-containing protein n=1 Tax=Blattamonas nauphoetae TaxID=2049346 RepID=A0ABQ9X9H0_9EUKA|nr:hypothetical protein BLNAU_17084 [Blattamonas nauphoetae]
MATEGKLISFDYKISLTLASDSESVCNRPTIQTIFYILTPTNERKEVVYEFTPEKFNDFVEELKKVQEVTRKAIST